MVRKWYAESCANEGIKVRKRYTEVRKWKVPIQKVKACLPQKIFLQQNKTNIFIWDTACNCSTYGIRKGSDQKHKQITHMDKACSNKIVPDWTTLLLEYLTLFRPVEFSIKLKQ